MFFQYLTKLEKNKFIGYAIYMYWRDREVEKKTISPREAWKFRDLMTTDWRQQPTDVRT